MQPSPLRRTPAPRPAHAGAPRRVVLAALVALPAVLAAACSRDPQATPEGAFQAFVSAMQASRSDVAARRRAYELLATPARASLAERAVRASQLSGRDIQPWEMLAPGRFTLNFQFDPEALTSRVMGDHAVVLVRGHGGDRAEVSMVLEQGRWRVVLSLPPMQPIRADGDAGAR